MAIMSLERNIPPEREYRWTVSGDNEVEVAVADFQAKVMADARELQKRLTALTGRECTIVFDWTWKAGEIR